MSLATALVSLAWGYSLIGAAVAAVFLTIGIDRLDEDARGAYAFRPLLIPGILLIWPLVLWRWLREETRAATTIRRYSPPRAAHGIAAALMAGVMLATMASAVAIRQTWPADIAPVLLEPPEGPSE